MRQNVKTRTKRIEWRILDILPLLKFIKGGKRVKKEPCMQKQLAEPHEMAAYLFHQGTNFLAYEYLGLHFEGEHAAFRVWAPNADYVCAVLRDKNLAQFAPYTRRCARQNYPFAV